MSLLALTLIISLLNLKVIGGSLDAMVKKAVGPVGQCLSHRAHSGHCHHIKRYDRTYPGTPWFYRCFGAYFYSIGQKL